MLPSQPPTRPAVERLPCRMLVPANLVEKKGHRHLLTALRHLKDRQIPVDVDLAGDGPLRGDLERQATALQVADHVRFRGALPHELLMQGLAQHEWDLVVLPSIVTRGGEHEGIPVSLMEAMAHGVPVIGTKTGGIPELVVEGTGLLVPPEDPLRLANAIAVLATDPDARERYGAAGRARVEEAFAVDATVASLLRCIVAHGAPAS